MPFSARRGCLQKLCRGFEMGPVRPSRGYAVECMKWGLGMAAEYRKTVERGYGQAHRNARKRLARQLPAPCGVCGETIWPDEPWHCSHLVDGDPSAGWVAAHPVCNQSMKARRRALRSRMRRW